MVELRGIESRDIEELRKQRNNLYHYFRQFKPISEIEQDEWFENNNDIMFAIEIDEELSGCCGLTYIDMKNRKADLSLYMFDNYINSDTDEALVKILDYGFNELGLNKIYTDIFEYDEKKSRLFENYGFKKDGVLRKHYYRDGKFWDAIVYSMLGEDYAKI